MKHTRQYRSEYMVLQVLLINATSLLISEIETELCSSRHLFADGARLPRLHCLGTVL